MWIFALLVAAIVIWHFLPKAQQEPPAPKFRREFRAQAHDPQWITLFEEHCESPAETAFLRAMIAAFNLSPIGGGLNANGLKLDFQVEVGRYRLDFLANGWLAIEIDGVTYHSSPEAQKRDGARDEFFESHGYTVLRIPAKVVFNDAEEAVRRVRSALAVGKRPKVLATPLTGLQRLGQTASTVARVLDDVHANTKAIRAKDEALKAAKNVFDAEKTAISIAIANGKRRVEIEQWLKKSPELRDDFELELQQVSLSLGEGSRTSAGPERPFVAIANFQACLPCQSLNLEPSIMQAAAHLSAERDAFFSRTRSSIRSNSDLAGMVEIALEEIGCSQVWKSIS